jgi:hypothetical protein
VSQTDPIEVLLAERDIAAVVARYCRGIDRLDLELVRSCYHDDAVDTHGSFSGGVEEYLAWVEPLLARYSSTFHFIGNQLIEFATPDRARVETYGISYHRSPSARPHLNLVTGFRFIDVFERRDRWAITRRAAITEWSMLDVPEHRFAIGPDLRQGRRDRQDPIYEPW